ncbi:8-amino-7-oxononanoate synthase [Raoultella terrigena]|uniref:8-amino-7-oxononanoate synthase n=1 Tax=Raoultella terrigena TaxID=577 RepID=A0A485B854_RAOTE|nr:8-amino-7-oxononanoate synthase [Raoultella terrigena]
MPPGSRAPSATASAAAARATLAATATRIVSLEEALADWLGYPRALLFISGFAANQALIAALLGKDDRAVADRLSHASLLEAASFSPAQLRRFQHNDVQQLKALLEKPLAGQQLTITEGVFSMDGDSAPLGPIQQVTAEAGGWPAGR